MDVLKHLGVRHVGGRNQQGRRIRLPPSNLVDGEGWGEGVRQWCICQVLIRWPVNGFEELLQCASAICTL
jgi:hypothetical protein